MTTNYPGAVDSYATDIDNITTITAAEANSQNAALVAIEKYGYAVFNVRTFGGAVGNAITNDASAIQATINACSAAGGGIVYVPPGSYAVGAQILVPYGVELRGAGRNSSFLIALSGTFPASTAVVRLGAVGVIGVACRVRRLGVDCASLAGSIGIYSEGIQENSGVYECMVRNYVAFGVQVKQGAGTLPQNYTLDDVEIFSGPSTGATAVGLAITGTSLSMPFRDISRITVFATGSTQLTSAITIDGSSSGVVRECHVENAVNGILVGANLSCFGTTFESITGNTNVTNVLVFSNAHAQDSLVAIGINPQGATNGIVDNLQSNTIPNQVGFYAFGNGGTAGCPIFTTDAHVQTRLVRAVMVKDLARSTTAPSFVASYTPDATAGEVVRMTLTANITVNNPSNSFAGQVFRFVFTQDGTGGRTITYGTNYKTGGGTAISTTLNTTNIDTFVCVDGTTWRLVSRITGQ